MACGTRKRLPRPATKTLGTSDTSSVGPCRRTGITPNRNCPESPQHESRPRNPALAEPTLGAVEPPTGVPMALHCAHTPIGAIACVHAAAPTENSSFSNSMRSTCPTVATWWAASRSRSSTKATSLCRISRASASRSTRRRASSTWPSRVGSSQPTSGTTSATLTTVFGAEQRYAVPGRLLQCSIKWRLGAPMRTKSCSPRGRKRV